MSSGERLLQFIDFKGFGEGKKGKSFLQFYKLVGLPPGSVKADRSMGTDNLKKIFLVFPELNMDWIITGRGEMLIDLDIQIASEKGLKQKKFKVKNLDEMISHELVELKAMLRTVLTMDAELLAAKRGDLAEKTATEISEGVQDEISATLAEIQRRYG